jgi:hypothetical protein
VLMRVETTLETATYDSMGRVMSCREGKGKEENMGTYRLLSVTELSLDLADF